jgi:hypothetical protein
MRRLIEFRENGSDLMGDGVNIAMRIIGGPSRASSRPLSVSSADKDRDQRSMTLRRRVSIDERW